MTQRSVFSALVVLLALAFQTGCSDSDHRSVNNSSTSVGPSTPATSSGGPTTTAVMGAQPPGTDIAAVTPALQALVDRYDSAVEEILRDPRVAADRTSASVRAYVDLFPTNSAFTEGALRSWVQDGDNGRFYRAGPRGRLTQSTVVTVLRSETDEAEFKICSLNSIEITDSTGALVESQGGVSAASVTALRIDGVWLLRDLSATSASGCASPGER